MLAKVTRLLAESVATLLLLATVADAQTSIAGRVTDETGGALPGVTVEASSSALIEKARAAVTDAQGLFTITNLRPGEYMVTYALEGFATVKREGLVLPDNFTATANAVLKVGDLQETITVTGQSPVVDVQRVQTTQVVPRELLDVLPSGRSYRSVAGLVTAVRPHKQSVADSGPLAQNLNARGMGTQQTIILYDGLTTNSFIVGQAGYANDAAVQEISYQTSANTADVGVGGLRANLVPRDGGNVFHGGTFFGDLEGRWQANNLDDELRARGLTQQNTTRFSRDFNPWLAGPVVKDRLWFLGSFRRTSNSQVVAQAFYRDGSPGINRIALTNLTARLTGQIGSSNKVSAHLDRVFRSNPDFVSPGQIVEESSKVFDPDHGIYATEQLRWTSTISSRMMFEAGWGLGVYRFLNDARSDVKFERNTPAWFANAPRSDTVLARTWRSANYGWQAPLRQTVMAALSYVTGSHALKAGIDQQWGEYITTNDLNADLTQIYLNGVPSFVDVAAAPNRVTSKLRSELGFYAMDSWKFKRLTADVGLRLDYFNAFIPKQGLPPGRFVPGREVEEIPCMPCFPLQIAPRLGAAYDLLGNGKTALKGGVYRYNSSPYLSLTQAYNPLNQNADRRTWRDANGDDIAQDGEIGPSNNLTFQTSRPNRRPDPDLRRPYVREYTLGIQHELLQGVAVSGSWDVRQFRNVIVTRNAAVSLSDYVPFSITNPYDGTPVTVFRLNNNRQGLLDQVDTTATNPDTARQTYVGYEFNVNARLPRGAALFGGVILERTQTVSCDVNDPNLLRFCDQTGQRHQELGAQPGLPLRKNFKLSGSQPLPFGVAVSVAFQSYGGTGLCTTDCADFLPVTYVVPSALFPGGQTQSVTLNLAAPGTRFVQRWNQLDMSFRKNFKFNRVEMEGRLEIYNLTNANSVLNENTAFGPRLGQPLEILTGRAPRLAVQVRF